MKPEAIKSYTKCNTNIQNGKDGNQNDAYIVIHIKLRLTDESMVYQKRWEPAKEGWNFKTDIHKALSLFLTFRQTFDQDLMAFFGLILSERLYFDYHLPSMR